MKWVMLFVLLSVSALACVVPNDGMKVGKPTEFCTDVYYLNKGITVSGHDFTVDCKGAVFTGMGNDVGIRLEKARNVTLKDCHVVGYITGLVVKDSSGILLFDNHLVRNRLGARFVNVNESSTFNHDVSLRAALEVVKSFRNVFTLTNKPVRGDFCRTNFCNESREGALIRVKPKTEQKEMKSWLSGSVKTKPGDDSFRKWIFGGLF